MDERPVVKSDRDAPIDEIEYSEMIDALGVIVDKEAFLKRVFNGVSSNFHCSKKYL